jgi:alanyl-tRNA synthetase
MNPTMRLYYDDPYLREFDAQIVDRVVAPGSLRYALDQTAFYPEGGGQPADTGTLNGVQVVDVQSEAGIVWHEVAGDLGAGELRGVLDWPRRFDHMQQHQGQHLLSAAFQNLFSIPTTSFHLGRTSVTIDLGAPEITESHLRDAERLANQVVWENRPIQARFVTTEDLARLRLRKLPVVDGDIRVVSVPDFDHSACGGTHPTHTGAVGLIFLLRSERRGAETRVEFACGGRALDLLRASHGQVQKLANELTVGTDELESAILRLRDSEVEGRKELTRARRSLIDYEASRLMTDARRLNGVALVVECLGERPGNELQDLALALSRDGALAVLGTPGSPAQIIMARPDTHTLDCATILKDVLAQSGGKGGGRPGMARGGLPNDQLESAIQLLEAAVIAAINGSDS